MQQVTSADGTPIAFERLGDGPPLIVVGGALCDRAAMRPLAEQLARHFTVINYDRRGRGDSGDTAPYAVQREVEDIGALIAEAGGSASVYGHSSGAALGLYAAADGLPVDGLVAHEPPFGTGSEEERRSSQEFAAQLAALLAEDRRGDAVELFLTTAGMPPEALAGMRADPWWATAEALAPTIAYESQVMDNSGGGTVPADRLAGATMPVLLLGGEASPGWMIEAGRRVADALPDGRHRALDGQGHEVAPEVVAPIVAEFLRPAAG